MDMYYPRDIARGWREYNKNTCFVLMPFEDKFRKVYSAILGELKKIGFYCTRVDLEDQDGAIINRIVKGIISSHFVIVDMSDKNPNVFYELGLSHALKDSANVILISQKIEDVPFDIKHLRVIVYEIDDMFSLVERVRRQIDTNKHGFDIKLALKLKYGHFTQDEAGICEIEDFFDPFITEYPYILLSLADSDEEIPFDPINVQSCLSKIKNGIECHTRTGGRIGNVLLKIYSDLLITFHDQAFVRNEILKALSRGEMADGFSEREKINHVMNLVFDLVSKESLKQEAIDWIIQYLSRPKVAGVDLARSRVEEFVIGKNKHDLNAQLIKVLSSKIDLQRENIADILGEIGDPSFVMALEFALKLEKNSYAARSIITALGKIAIRDSGRCIVQWIKDNIEEIIKSKTDFVFHYTGPALSSIDHRNGTSYFQEFNKILTSYQAPRTE